MEDHDSLRREVEELRGEMAKCLAAGRRRDRRGRLILLGLGIPFLLAATVTVKNADLLIDRNGTNSYWLKLRGNDGAADKEVNVRTTAGGGTYRLSVYENTGATELWSVNKDGDETVLRNLSAGGNVALGDASTDTVTIEGDATLKGNVSTSKVNGVLVVGSADYPTIASALAAATSGSKIFIPAGTWSESGLTVGANDITIEGCGRSTVIQTAVNTNIFYSLSRSGLTIRGVYFKFTVAPPAANQVAVNLNFSGNYTDVAIEDCWFENCLQGVWAAGGAAGTGKRITIRNNRFVNCRYSVYLTGNGAASDYLTDVTVSDNVMDCLNVVSSVGVYNDHGKRVTISGNVIDDPNSWGIRNVSGHRNAITGNTIYSSGSYGIYSDSSYYTSISGNAVNSAGSYGIYNNAAPYGSIASNCITQPASTGIENINSSYVSVTGNTVTNSGAHGIHNNGGTVCMTGNSIYSAAIGIYNGGPRCAITGNSIESTTSDGVYNEAQAYCTITGNSIYSAGGIGVECWNGWGNVVSSNSIYSTASYGIYNTGSDTAITSNVVFYPTWYAIYDQADRVLIDGNNLRISGTATYGIYHYIGDDVTISDNQVWDPTGIGIGLFGESWDRIYRGTVSGNHVIYATTAIQCNYVTRPQVMGNVIEANSGDGIWIQLSDNGVISDNIVWMGNGGARAIYVLDNSYFSMISGNNTNWGWDGIAVSSSECCITGNMARSAGASGIYADSYCSTITGNRVSGNQYGIYLGAATDYSAITGNFCDLCSPGSAYTIVLVGGSDVNVVVGNGCGNYGLTNWGSWNLVASNQ